MPAHCAGEGGRSVGGGRAPEIAEYEKKGTKNAIDNSADIKHRSHSAASASDDSLYLILSSVCNYNNRRC